jgi:signal transduction histidine kinase
MHRPLFLRMFISALMAGNLLSESLRAETKNAEAASGLLEIKKVRIIDGGMEDTRNPALVQMRSSTRLLEVRIQSSSETGPQPRWRYRLEGVDSDWRDAGGWMRITARFSDENGAVIGGEERIVQGQSQGWTGDPATSPFHSERLFVRVPPNARRLRIWTCTGGPNLTVGIHALKDLTAVLHPKNPEAPPTRHPLLPDSPANPTEPGTPPPGWSRHGTEPALASVSSFSGSPPALVLQDHSAATHGGWLTTEDLQIPVHEASAVTLEWKHAYSIGWAGSATVSYAFVPAGNYPLRVQPLTLAGIPSGKETVVPIAVLPPFHQALWFQALVLLGGSLGVFLFTHALLRRRHAQKVQAMAREKAVLDERLRIARDLHDSLGADLTHLALLSELAQRNPSNPDSSGCEQMFDAARKLTRRVDEIVWALNPAQDSLPRFIEFVANHAQKFLSSACIRCRLDLPPDPPQVPLQSAARHDLFLALKELLHNVVKHSHASEVRLRLVTEPGCLLLTVADNGCGFPTDAVPGNGTVTLRSRMDRLGGQIRVSETPGGGTTVSLRIPL